MNLKEMHKVYEIGDANKPDWKEFQPEYNVFPGIVDWDPDSPGACFCILFL